MASTISVAFQSKLTVTETFTPFAAPAASSIILNGLDESGTYTASTTPPVSKASIFTLTLSGGSGSINLAAIPGLDASQVIDGTGLKLQFMKLTNPATNANKIQITKGASNGYGLDAAGSAWTENIDPGQSRTYSLNNTAPTVASGARTMDVTGTGTQQLQVELILG